MTPTGTIAPHLGKDAPNGWLVCDGSAVPKDDRYADLRSVIGDTLPDPKPQPLRLSANPGTFKSALLRAYPTTYGGVWIIKI